MTLKGTKTSALAKEMHRSGTRRAYILWKDGAVQCSCPDVLRPLLDYVVADKVDYDEHEGLFVEAYKDCLFGAFLWRTHRGQGCGGIRLREYESAEAFLQDGMRLAIGMGRKNALANLWWGGGKGVIAYGEDRSLIEDKEKRTELLRAYGRFMTSLRGCYVGAEDAGITVQDVDIVYQTTRFLTCISPSLGGSGNPSVPTAMGIVCGMEGALDALNLGTLEGKSVAIQGLGNVGGPLVKFLFEKGVARIVATDVDPKREAFVKNECKEFLDRLTIHIGKTYPILEEEVDIVSPCAFGGILNEDSVPTIKAKIVCGAANNQLLHPDSDYGMHERGIVYCPDFVVNRMGIVNCANEGSGRVGDPGGVTDPLIQVHLGREDSNSIFNVVKTIIHQSQSEGKTTVEIANSLADQRAHEDHPIFGHRSKQIIDMLVLDGWHKGCSSME